EEAQAEEIIITGSANSAVRVDDVSRGFSYAWPRRLQPVGNSPYSEIRLVAAWPGELSNAELIIENAASEDVQAVDDLIVKNGTAWTNYTGEGLPAGEYNARFELTNGAGETLTIRESFVVEKPSDYPQFPEPLELT